MKTKQRVSVLLLVAVCGLWSGAGSSFAQVDTSSVAEADVQASNSEPAQPNDAQVSTNTGWQRSDRTPGRDRNAIVVFGRNVELKAGDSAEAVVVIGGSAKIDGNVRDAVVAIGGNLDVKGRVGDAAVAVGGSINADGEVGDAVVAVMGNVTAGTNANIHGDVVSVGGRADITDGAKIGGQVQEVDFNIPGLPNVQGLSNWFKYCVLEFRPLAFQVTWVWIVAGVFFCIYLLVALAFPRPVQVCVEELNQRPATTFLVGLLAKILVPIIILVLTVTGIGVLVVPFLVAGLFFVAVLGKVALLEYLGAALARPFGLQMLQRPVAAFLIGSILVTLLYVVPYLGFVAYAVFALWGLGTAITGGFRRLRRETPRQPVSPPASLAPVAPLYAAVPPADAGAATAGQGTQQQSFAPPPDPIIPPVQPAVPAPLAHPRAGFWLRACAAALDTMLVCVIVALIHSLPDLFNHRLPLDFIAALAYFTLLWTWRGTSIGGIVFKLHVVRADGSPLTFLVALVRALAGVFSGLALFLGFFWIGWDREKQGWHDKIAGTIVVRLPHSVPLVCI